MPPHKLCMLPINPTPAPNPHDRSAVSQTYGSRDTTPRVHDAQHYPVLSFRLFNFGFMVTNHHID